MHDKEVACSVARIVAKFMFDTEITYISSTTTLSTLHNNHAISQIESFAWSDLWTDLTETAPMLTSTLEFLTLLAPAYPYSPYIRTKSSNFFSVTHATYKIDFGTIV